MVGTVEAVAEAARKAGRAWFKGLAAMKQAFRSPEAASYSDLSSQQV